MSIDIVVRPLEEADVDAAAAIHREAFAALGERGWNSREIADTLGTPGAAGRVAVGPDGSVVGMALCRTTVDEAELLTIAVQPGFRRRGIGALLLKVVIALVRDRSARHLFLEVAADNPAAQTLYRATGFRPVGRRRGYYSRSGGMVVDALVMVLEFD